MSNVDPFLANVKTNNIAGGNADEAQPKPEGPKVLFNIYDTTEDAKMHTAVATFGRIAKKVKKEKAKEWGVTKNDLFQCDSTMWCCLQSNTGAITNWKFEEKSGKVEAYKTWFANKGEGVPATLLPEALAGEGTASN